jgi:uncharacterized protein (TIGR00296 family)
MASGIHAARDDGRFTPLQPDEPDGLDVEISVLTEPTSVDFYEDFVLVEEGVILEKDGRNAVFLPEVPVEYHWNRERMLSRLAIKAGFPPMPGKKAPASRPSAPRHSMRLTP